MSFIKDAFFGGKEKKAARAEIEGLERGIEEQRRQFDLTREDFAPSIEGGDVGRERLLELLGLRGAEAEAGAIGAFQESPGQKFLRERAERTLLRSASATGGLKGGNIQTALQEQAIGIASGQLGERKDRLERLAGIGTGAVTSQASIGGNLSTNIAQLLSGQGQARASGIRGQAAAIRRSLEQVAGTFTGGKSSGLTRNQQFAADLGFTP